MNFFESLLSLLKTIQIRDIVDIIAIALIIFGLFKLIRETRAVQLLKGVLVLFIIYFLSSLFGLVMLSSLLRMFFEAAVILIAIIFQPEIRKALEQMGRNNTYKKYLKFFTKHGKSDEWKKAVRKSIIDAADTAVLFSRSRTGALLVFERETMLSDIAATGTIVDAETSVALFGIFFLTKLLFTTEQVLFVTVNCLRQAVYCRLRIIKTLISTWGHVTEQRWESVNKAMRLFW